MLTTRPHRTFIEKGKKLIIKIRRNKGQFLPPPEIKIYDPFLIFIIFAGIPPTTTLSGISFVTTAFAPTVTLLPILTFPRILAPKPK